MKSTMKALAEYIGMTPQGLNYMKNNNKKKFEILWIGWLEFCKTNE